MGVLGIGILFKSKFAINESLQALTKSAAKKSDLLKRYYDDLIIFSIYFCVLDTLVYACENKVKKCFHLPFIKRNTVRGHT